MALKSLIQVVIITLIISILGFVYLKYFNIDQNIVEEIKISEKAKEEQIAELENKLFELETKNIELNNKISAQKNEQKENKIKYEKDNNENKIEKDTEKILKAETQESIENDEKLKNDKTKPKKIKINNLVKDIEYSSIDEKGNRFYLKAKSGKSNKNNNNILDLENVRGQINSQKRDTIYIISDFAQYNSSNLNSKFYNNVIINYQDKEITCINFDINMETNKAVAYNDVVIVDPNSEMKAGIVEFDLKTKDININPENATTEIKVVTN